MKVCIICPPTVPINAQSKYVGIERLTWEYSRELIKEHDVTVLGHYSSEYPDGVKLLPSSNDEVKQYQSYQYLLRTFDVIHDFSHLHLASRYNKNLPSLNIFWHAPALARYPKAPYNIIALSHWAEREFKRVYHQGARYHESIGIDHKVYKISKRHRSDRFLTIGRMAPEKGNLEAIILCRDLDVPLDVVGGRGIGRDEREPLSDYETAIKGLCDGEKIRFLGEVTEEQKVKLMQDCKGLIYSTTHPEVTSHKIQEAMFCGAPVIVPNVGATKEIVTHGVNGYICTTDESYHKAILGVDKLNPMAKYRELINKYEIGNVIKGYLPLYEEVKGGLRW